MIQRDRDHRGDEHGERDDPHHADVLREAREEVDQQDLDPVERVVEHRGDQPELQQPDDRVLVDADDAVVGVRVPSPTTAVSITWAKRNRMIATPVMRWSNQEY